MELKQFSIFIGIAVLVGSMLLVKKVKGDRYNKVKDGFFLIGIAVALILFIVGLFN